MSAAPAANRLRRLAAAVAWPLGAFLLARALLLLVALQGGHPVWSAGLWTRWDSYLYLLVAAHGYDLVPCGPETGYAPTDWCGTAGWFPLYPALLALVARTGMPPATAGVAVSAACAIASLVVLWAGLLRSRATPRHVLVLLLAALAPGFVYQHAVFPVSLAILLVLLVLLFVERGRWWAAGACALLASTTHSSLVVLAPVLAAWTFLATRGLPARARLARFAALPGLAALGYLFVHAVLRAYTGAWDAYFRVLGKYGAMSLNPFATLFAKLRAGVTGQPRPDLVAAYQTLVVLVLVVVVATIGAREVRAGRAGAVALAAMFVVATWLLPLLVGPQVSLYRTEALLVPAVLVLRALPARWLAVVLVASVGVGLPMAADFFARILV